jgi:hypothetical protein
MSSLVAHSLASAGLPELRLAEKIQRISSESWITFAEHGALRLR